jgi:hypothetical protein
LPSITSPVYTVPPSGGATGVAVVSADAGITTAENAADAPMAAEMKPRRSSCSVAEESVMAIVLPIDVVRRSRATFSPRVLARQRRPW